MEQYLAELPADRRALVESVRSVILDNLDPAIEEGMQYGMIGYYVPHSVYPAGYHCDPSQPLPYAGIASQKHHVGFYFFCIYTDESMRDWFEESWRATGRRLDMGKSCVRVKKPEDVAFDVIGETVRRISAEGFIREYEANFGRRRPAGDDPPGQTTENMQMAARKKAAKKKAKKKTAKKAGAKKATKKKAKKKVARKATKKKATKKAAKKKTKKKAAKKKASKKKATKKKATKKAAKKPARKKAAKKRARKPAAPAMIPPSAPMMGEAPMF